MRCRRRPSPLVAPHLTERQRRLLVGAAARALGYGGVSRVARLAEALTAQGHPVSDDTVGFANGGAEWQPSGEPEQVNVHDFPDPTLAKAIPYGVDDLGRNTGWVGVGTDHDTAAFAVATLRRWCQQVGRFAYPKASRLLVCADAGGSNGCRVRPWKIELARLATDTGLAITVTQTDLRVRAELDRGRYPLGVKVSDEELAAVPLARHAFHGEWSYTIQPTTRSSSTTLEAWR